MASLSHPQFSVLAVSVTHHRDPDPLRRLAVGVFYQALRDARLLQNYPRRRVKKGSPTAVRRGLIRRDAVRFLTGGGEAFRYWCRALDLDAERVRVIMKRKLIRLKRLRRLRKLRKLRARVQT